MPALPEFRRGGAAYGRRSATRRPCTTNHRQPKKEPAMTADQPANTHKPAKPVRGMSRAEAGRKGGSTTRDRYGVDYFARIGKMGGAKGGETTRDRYGREHYERIGRIGGSR